MGKAVPALTHRGFVTGGPPAHYSATWGDYTKVSFTYAIHERMQYDYGGRLLQAPALIGT